MFRRFTVYRQLDSMDCGPACLRMIFKHYGKQISLESIRKATQFGKRGISLLDLSQAAEKYGFRTISAKLTLDQLLYDVPLPCILYWRQHHFVVLTPSSNNKSLRIADPTKGLLTFSRREFLEHWVSLPDNAEGRGIALLLEPRAAFYAQSEEKSSKLGWKLLSRYTLKYKSQIAQLFLGLFLGSVLQLVFPYLTQSIVDTGIGTKNLHFIQIILIAQFALFFSRTAVEFIRSRILLFVSTHVNLSILSDFWIKLTRLPLSFFDTKHTGDILQRINDHGRIESFITGTALNTLFSVFNLITFSIVLLFYNTTIFYIFSAGSLLYLLWIRLFLKFRRVLDYTGFALASKKSSMTMQMIYGMQDIKLNNAEHLKRWEWEGLQAAAFKLGFRSLSLSQYQRLGAVFVNEGKNILITYFVAIAVVNGELTLGAMLAIQYIIGQLNSPVEQLVNFTQHAQDAEISLERLNDIHELKDEEPADVTLATRISENHSIVFSNISFAYPTRGEEPVIKNLNLELPGGKVTAIVGTSGSGKTTILKLIQKFYNGYTGEIKVGETNLKYISPYYWRSITGSVMQDGYIFSDSIEKNIAVGDENPSYERLLSSCKIADIISYIEKLPQGFNTKIGPEGIGLSAGQKQRILIARAVYKNPSFIFFDEATNSLDSNTENVIIENLQEFFKGRTVLVIAHRLSTVKNASKIVVLENGEIIEEGVHLELLYRKGKYYELVKNQLEVSA